MKTLMLFQEVPDGSTYFFELESPAGYKHLDKVYINSDNTKESEGVSDERWQELCDDLNALVYNAEGMPNMKPLPAPTKDWDEFIQCGFYM